MLKIATWNVNSIRKRIDHLCEWLISHKIDIALLQEIKCTNDQFPYKKLEDLGYKCYVNGQKTRNGVAVITKYPVSGEITNSIFTTDKTKTNNSNIVNQSTYYEEEARYIECTISYNQFNLKVASVYVPNGQSVGSEAFQYKLNFLDKLYEHLLYLITKEEVLIIGGDYNVALDELDVCSPEELEGKLCFHIKEREKLRSIINLGFIDAFRAVNNDQRKFSWWNYKAGAWQNNKGLRIDYLLLSPQAADKLTTCVINDKMRDLSIPSDHAPVECIIY